MKLLMIVVGVVLLAAGTLFTLQGVGVVAGSAMSGVTLWAVLGPIIALVGLGLLITAVRRRRPV